MSLSGESYGILHLVQKVCEAPIPCLTCSRSAINVSSFPLTAQSGHLGLREKGFLSVEIDGPLVPASPFLPQLMTNTWMS